MDVEGLPGYTMAHVGDARFYRGPDSRLCVTVSTLLAALAGRVAAVPQRRTFVSARRGPPASRAGVGNAAHRMAACRALGRDAAPLAGEPAEAALIAGRIARELDLSMGHALAVERNLVSTALRIGGTPDLVATWSGELAVIEHKTRRRVGDRPAGAGGEWPARREDLMQAAAYAHMWAEAAGEAPTLLVVLVADADSCARIERRAAPWMRALAGPRVLREAASLCALAEEALAREPAGPRAGYQSCA